LRLEEHVQKQSFNHVIHMMTECQFSSPNFLGKTIKRASSEPRAKRTSSFTFWNLTLDNGISILVNYVIINTFSLKKLWQYMLWKARLLLIKIHRHNTEFYFRNSLQVQQSVKHYE